MKQTIFIKLEDRFGDVERIISLFSGSGYKIKKMNLSESNTDNLSKFVLVIDELPDRNIKNILVRIEQIIRVKSVEWVKGDELNNPYKLIE